MNNRYYKIVDKHQITPKPRILKIDGYDVFTNDEEVLNNEGYYRLKRTYQPDDGYTYIPSYELIGNEIEESWEIVEQPLSEVIEKE